MTQEPSVLNTAAQGGVAATTIAFMHTALSNMIPYAIVAIPLIVLDLMWGVRAAHHRNERITFSRAFRRTMSKTFDYICWIVIASGLALAFEAAWLEWLILGAVIFNEITSIVSNFLETKGIIISFLDIYRWMFKRGAEKVGLGVSDEEAASIIGAKPESAKDETSETQE